MNGLRCAAILLSLASLHFAGCCCVPNSNCISPMGGCGTGSCDDGAPRHPGLFDCECGGSGCGSCGSHVLAKIGAHKSCQGACGEVYYDEWINEPPVADNCGFSCGGCGACGQCRPLLKKLRMLWGNPYHACCPSPFECGGSCGCDTCGHGGHMAAGYAPSALRPAAIAVAPMARSYTVPHPACSQYRLRIMFRNPLPPRHPMKKLLRPRSRSRQRTPMSLHHPRVD